MTDELILSASPLDEETRLQEMLGYLNFSNGTPAPHFQAHLNELSRDYPDEGFAKLIQTKLLEKLATLKGAEGMFSETRQVEAALELTILHTLPAYREHHRDQFFQVPDATFEEPFFLARIFEAVLSQDLNAPREEVVSGALDQLNCFIGYRPLAILENRQQMQAYDHERFCPHPLYLKGAGVLVGEAEEMLKHTLRALQHVPEPLLREACFVPEHLDEVSLDMRAHDHNHPVNKRTNYMFGEWDPHLIDTKGNFRRFLLRKIIMDALLNWSKANSQLSLEERLFDTSSVLCGTMLMASAISGSGPASHSSEISLSSLLPRVARLRDAYYYGLLQSVTGERKERLQREADLTQQPFGHVRQALNIYLAGYGAMQVQLRHLSQLYARMGYPEEAREKTDIIPCASMRFECEIQLRITTAHLHLTSGELETAVTLLSEMEDLLKRGINCGAFVDPWNILGFQGHFPLFHSREDVVVDQRVEVLMELVEQIFEVYARALSKAAELEERALSEQLSHRFEQLADFWDKFASTTVNDLPKVSGSESWESAVHVAETVSQWRAAGEGAGDISFWSEHVDRLNSAKSYALVVKTLLEKNDQVAAMGLLMHWLSRGEEVGLESGMHSIHRLLLQWVNQTTANCREDVTLDWWTQFRRLFAFLESNAGIYWEVPTLQELAPNLSLDDEFEDELDDSDEFEEYDEDNLFGAAYDEMVFRDSTDDGVEGDTLDGSYFPTNTEFDIIGRSLEPRLRFLNSLAQLWQIAGCSIMLLSREENSSGKAVLSEEKTEHISTWRQRANRVQRDLNEFMNQVWDYEVSAPSGDHDSNVEYDIQLQRKLYLLHTIIATSVNAAAAERFLLACLPAQKPGQQLSAEKKELVAVYRGVLQRNEVAVRKHLPKLLSRMSKRPLLYIPLENGGEPRQILGARNLQSVIRFLLRQLPELGLLKGTWDVLKTAYGMERTSRPGGIAVTEFDRLFKAALTNSLTCVVRSAANWEDGNFSDEDLVDQCSEITLPYKTQWNKHSNTMRISSVEAIYRGDLWDETREFIETYGADLFHAKMLTLGNVRAILHNGVPQFLHYLAMNQDPIHPVKLIEDLENGVVDFPDVSQKLELIYGVVVDKFDRFLEYNTTTTQSDYGEKFFCLLEFLRVEADYDRDAWNLTPMTIAHEVLCRQGKVEAAYIWETLLQTETRELAEEYVQQLQKLERRYGMHLPSLADHINQRFVKLLAVNRMAALVPQAMKDVSQLDQTAASKAFPMLSQEVDAYLEDVTGSGIDIPPWLRSLEREVNQNPSLYTELDHERDPGPNLPPRNLTVEEFRKELSSWNEPLHKRPPNKKRKRDETP